ncbi:FG-GAP repeat protein [candidate division KSB1 bacterium]|nr:FG-GAP repeat protein [candidate division KSB1 bacterium]
MFRIFKQELWLVLAILFISQILIAQGIFTDYYATYMGTHPSERIGYAMNPGGDINNDGFDDWIMGTFHYNNESAYWWDRGAVYVGLGKPDDQGMNKSISQLDARFLGTNGGDGIGYSVAAGDINGDGYDDILIGGPDGAGIPGHAYLVFGKSNIDWGINADINQAASVRFNGTENGEGAGISVAVIGDMDGDGCSEFLISASSHPTATRAGKVCFFKGKPSGWASQIDLRYPDVLFSTTSSNSRLGYWAEGVGDVNGDGIPDFAMGAWGIASHNDHRVYLFLGRTAMNWAANTDVSNADVVLYSSGLGWNVRPAGDVNGDGYDDFIMADIGYDGSRGIVYLVLGRATFPTNMGPGSMSASLYGENSGDVAGFWISRAGDVNADGLDDFMIGAQNYSIPNLRNGKAYMVLGRTTGWVQNMPLSSISNTLVGETTETIQLGECVSYLGDINGDGGDDYAVAAPYFDPWGIYNAGKIYLFKGTAQRTIIGECLHDPSGAGVSDVELAWDSSNAATDQDGAYTCNVASLTDFRVTPSKPSLEDVPFGAISAYDASLIARYEIGLTTLGSDQLAVADVNDDSYVNMIDAVCVARAVVGMEALAGTYAGNWRFDPEYRDYINFSSNQTGQDYSVSLRGDVDMDWADYLTPKHIANPDDMGVHVLQGEQGAEIFLSYNSNESLFSAEVLLEFEEADLNAIQVVKGEAASAFQLFSGQKPGQYRACVFGARPIEQSGQLMKLAIEFVPETICIDIQYRINNYAFVKKYFELSQGQVTKPENFQLTSHPNPFNPSTLIQIHFSEDLHLDLTIYNLSGQPIKNLVHQHIESGSHQFSWNGRNESGHVVSSGIYLCRVETDHIVKTLKLVKVK